MPDIKRFLSHALLLILLVALACCAIYLALPPDESSYFAATLDKRRLLETTPSPRLVFVGGSSLVFGLDSEAVSQALGLPVVNYGLYAGFGLRFMLNDLAPYVRSGDILILVPEYEHFYNDLLEGKPESLAGMFEVYPPAVHSLVSSQMIDLPVICTHILRIKVNRALAGLFGDAPEETYTRTGFNAYGDLVGHLDQPGLRVNDDPYILPSDRFNRQAIDALNAFSEFATAQDAVVYLVFPPARQSNCRGTEEQFDQFLERLQAGLSMPLIASPQDFCLPDGYFFDSPYHTDRRGREAYSTKLSATLSAALSAHSQPR